jgi:hypothetical protein
VIVAFEDETWTSLYPKIEAEWMAKGKQREVRTPGRNKRRNVFVTLVWPKRKNGFIFNAYAKRRSREFKHHLLNLIHYGERHRARKIILFVDHAPVPQDEEREEVRQRAPNPEDQAPTQEGTEAQPGGVCH